MERINHNYDAGLKEIEMLNLHPTFMPFIGADYDVFKILHIGESHYINQSPDNEKYDIQYFKKWWSEPCDEILDDSYGWADTRQVMKNYMDGKYGAYSIFNNFLKSFSKIVLNKQIESITLEDKGLYRYLAFMNFFQMPSIYEGKKYWDSLYISAKKLGNKAMARDMWEIAVEKSVNTIDAVVDIIKPKAIVFTSISAGNAYKDAGGKYKDDTRMIFTSHPGYPFTWWKKLKSLDRRRGIDVMEEGLKTILK